MNTATSSQFSDPFKYLDAKLDEFQSQRATLKTELEARGWKLRPNHPISGVWRARRWTKKLGTSRLSAATADALLDLVRAEHASRPKKKEPAE